MERSAFDGHARAGSWLLILLLVLSVGAFGLTRVLRSEDDIVNTVALTSELTPAPDQVAEITFDTTEPDSRADVLIVDTDEQQVRALQLGEPLPAGRHEFTWDGTGDDGELVPPGQYGIRVILGEQDRDIVPPGSVIVNPPSPGTDAGGTTEDDG